MAKSKVDWKIDRIFIREDKRTVVLLAPWGDVDLEVECIDNQSAEDFVDFWSDKVIEARLI